MSEDKEFKREDLGTIHDFSEPVYTAGLLGARVPGSTVYGDVATNARLDEIERRILAIEANLQQLVWR